MTKKSFSKLLFTICLEIGLTAASGCVSPAQQSRKQTETKKQNNDAGDIFSDNGNGTISFTYNNTGNIRYKVVVQLSGEGGKMYQYDVPEGEVKLNIPMTQGNGTYKVYLVRQTESNKYASVAATSFELNLTDENSVFLTNSVIIDWEETNAAIKKAQELTRDAKSEDEKIKAIYDYTVTNYTYDYDKMNNVDSLSENIQYIPNLEDTYNTQTGICYDLSVLVASMLRSVDIPAKVVTGYTTTTLQYHAWNNVFLEKKEEWKVMDVTYDVQAYAKDKRRVSMYKKAEDYYKIVYVY